MTQTKKALMTWWGLIAAWWLIAVFVGGCTPLSPSRTCHMVSHSMNATGAQVRACGGGSGEMAIPRP